MKILQIFAVATLVLTAGGFHCRPSYEQSGLIGKLVINVACGNYAVEVVSGNIDPAKVVAVWKQPGTGNVYSKVFAVSDACVFGQSGIKTGELFSFSLSDSTIVQNCMSCDIAVALPPVSNAVVNVRPWH